MYIYNINLVLEYIWGRYLILRYFLQYSKTTQFWLYVMISLTQFILCRFTLFYQLKLWSTLNTLIVSVPWKLGLGAVSILLQPCYEKGWPMPAKKLAGWLHCAMLLISCGCPASRKYKPSHTSVRHYNFAVLSSTDYSLLKCTGETRWINRTTSSAI